MSRITKNELITINAELSAEVAALRAKVSELTVSHQATGRAGNSAESKVHEYANWAEAKFNLLRLKAWDKDHRYVFTQVRNTIRVQPRSH